MVGIHSKVITIPNCEIKIQLDKNGEICDIISNEEVRSQILNVVQGRPLLECVIKTIENIAANEKRA